MLPRNSATATLQSPGHVQKCESSGAVSENHKTDSKKKESIFRTRPLCAGLTRASFGVRFLYPFFFRVCSHGHGNAAFVRLVSSGSRSPGLKKPRRIFQRRDQRAIH